MSEILVSVGLDVGTTSTQMVVSRLKVVNRASEFTVPELEIGEKTVVYKSPVHFTPLLDESHMDGPALRQLVLEEYRRAGISRETVDTGAIIITGETSRKENARAVLNALSDLAGDFVVATAGPDLESVLAARGAGAVDYSAQTGKTVLHLDIGGGTSNLCLIRQGGIVATGCLNVGGRLLKLDPDGKLTYVSPVLRGIWSVKEGERVTREQVMELCAQLTRALEMAAGLLPAEPILEKLTTAETARLPLNKAGEDMVISFSGGVADCIRDEKAWLAFGDMGPELGRCIRESRLCAGNYTLGSETIRATVIGAGCHSAMLSGSTVFCQNVALPLKNIPVVNLSAAEQEDMARFLPGKIPDGETVVIALPGIASPGYRQVAALAEQIARLPADRPIYLCVEQDMAKALGQAIALRTGPEAKILCIDRVKIGAGSFLDVGAAVGPAFPVVVKTLILNR